MSLLYGIGCSGNRQEEEQEYIQQDTKNYCVVLQSTEEEKAKSRPLNTRCSLFTGSPSGEQHNKTLQNTIKKSRIHRVIHST
jgi:hypothetical protein